MELAGVVQPPASGLFFEQPPVDPVLAQPRADDPLETGWCEMNRKRRGEGDEIDVVLLALDRLVRG
jgi:hypothetical protein